MSGKAKSTLGTLLMAALFAAGAPNHQNKTPDNPPPPDRLVLGEDDVKQLLLLMDTNKNGKISKQEYMRFMEAEFDRLDKNKNGELDPKELTGSRLRVTPFSHVGK
jgi:EF hand